MSHASEDEHSSAELIEDTPPARTTQSLMVAATQAIRDELQAAQAHILQAADLTGKFFAEVPHALQALVATQLPPTNLTTEAPHRPLDSPRREVHEVREVHDTSHPLQHVMSPYLQYHGRHLRHTHTEEDSDTDWTETQLTILAGEKLNDVRRPSWKAGSKGGTLRREARSQVARNQTWQTRR